MTGRGGLVSRAHNRETAVVRNLPQSQIEYRKFSMWLAESADIQRFTLISGRYFGAFPARFMVISGGGEVEHRPVCRDTDAPSGTKTLTPKFPDDVSRVGMRDARAREVAHNRMPQSSFGDGENLVGRRSGNPLAAGSNPPAPGEAHR